MSLLRTSPVFHKNIDAYMSGKYDYIINQGGTSSTKTFSTLQLLVAIALKHSLHIEVFGQTVPHLKSGVINDMPHVMKGFGLKFGEMYNISDKRISFSNGAVIQFTALDNAEKAHGGRRDIAYINEANHIAYPIAEQIMMRTRKITFIDYNPTAEFWVHKSVMPENEDKCILIKSTYRDNPFLEKKIIDYILNRAKNDENFRRVYVEGELGITEGLVFSNFEYGCDFDKEVFEKYRHGVDWGFSQDPFAYVRMAIENNCLYICDEIYEKNLLNKQSAPMVQEIAKKDIVHCDSAEPKSVSEYQSLGINARSAKKGQGSIESGIKYIQSFDKVYIHEDCTHIREEFLNYSWQKDKNGEELPRPVDNFNHAIDAIRYGLEQDMHFMRTQLKNTGRPF